jgi:hypothetical protein
VALQQVQVQVQE